MGNLKKSFNNSSMKNKQISKMISLKFIRIAWTRMTGLHTRSSLMVSYGSKSFGDDVISLCKCFGIDFSIHNVYFIFCRFM